MISRQASPGHIWMMRGSGRLRPSCTADRFRLKGKIFDSEQLHNRIQRCVSQHCGVSVIAIKSGGGGDPRKQITVAEGGGRACAPAHWLVGAVVDRNAGVNLAADALVSRVFFLERISRDVTLGHTVSIISAFFLRIMPDGTGVCRARLPSRSPRYSSRHAGKWTSAQLLFSRASIRWPGLLTSALGGATCPAICSDRRALSRRLETEDGSAAAWRHAVAGSMGAPNHGPGR